MDIDEQGTETAGGKRGRTIGGEWFEDRSKRGKGNESEDTPHILPIPPEQLFKTEPGHPMFYKWEKVDEDKLSEEQKRKLEAGRKYRADLESGKVSAKDVLEEIRNLNEEKYMKIVEEAQRLWEEDMRREAEEAAQADAAREAAEQIFFAKNEMTE